MYNCIYIFVYSKNRDDKWTKVMVYQLQSINVDCEWEHLVLIELFPHPLNFCTPFFYMYSNQILQRLMHVVEHDITINIFNFWETTNILIYINYI